MTYELPNLPFKYDELEPFMDEETVKIHHNKHHQGYCDKFNAALANHPEWADKDAVEVIKRLNELPKEIQTAVRNTGGGFVNHNLFWEIIKKDVPLQGAIKEAIETQFKSFDMFKEQFTKAAATQFGSGWAWLVVNEDKKLEIMQTGNQDSPWTIGKIPILTIDVWEHAYYLKYQNKRPEFIEQFYNLINWEQVNFLYEQALK